MERFIEVIAMMKKLKAITYLNRPEVSQRSSSMLLKSRWIGDWFLRRAAGHLNRARMQGNQILILAYDEISKRPLQLLNDG